MSKEFIHGAESLVNLFLKKLARSGDLCDSCNKKVVDLCEMLRERIRDKKLEKLELELEL
ncbi:MAG: hypothetical protein V3V98_03350 [Thermoplasmata archaeon]